MISTRELSSQLYRLASEMRHEEGCTTMDPAAVEAAALRLDEQTVQINELQRRLRAHHSVPSQPLQPLAVSAPVGSTVGGDAPVVVQVYALGSGVTAVRNQGDLLGREGTLELEANGQFLVFDPLAARVADGLVTTVERYVASVGHAVEAVDQTEGSEVGLQGHAVVPPKAAILSLPQGHGKTMIGMELARWLGLSAVIDGWHPGWPLEPGALHLTNAEVPA